MSTPEPLYSADGLNKEHEALLSENQEDWDAPTSSGSCVQHCSVPRSSRRRYQCIPRGQWPIWLHTVFVATYTVIFLAALVFGQSWTCNRRNCSAPATGSSFESLAQTYPLREAFRYSRQVVDYNFEATTAFKGPPVEEVEKAWQDLINRPHELRLSEDDVKLGNISTVQLSDGSGDYMVQPQAYHMFHCLYNMYKYAHPEFYGKDPGGPEWIKTHTDHCIDNLRMFVKCHAGGTGVTTYKWISGRKIPWPVLTSEEVCVDWEYFDGWVQERSIDLDDLRNMGPKRLLVNPEMGLVEYDDFGKAMVHDDRVD